MAITNQLNLWSSDTDGNVISSEGLGLSTQCKNGFQRDNELPSSIFNGILRETSLVTKSFVNALSSLNTTAGVTIDIDAMTSVSDLSTAIASVLNGMQTGGGGGGTSGTANNLAGGSAGSLPYQVAANTTTFLAKGSQGYVLRCGSSAPYWDDPSHLPVSTTAENAENVIGGAANQILCQTNTDKTGFISVPGNIATGWAITWSSQNKPVWSSTVLYASTAGNISGGELGAIPYQNAAGATTFLEQPKSGGVSVTGKLLKSGPNGAPSWETNWTINSSQFYSGSHSSSSDSNVGALLQTSGLHIRTNSLDGSVTVTNGTISTVQDVSGFTVQGSTATAFYTDDGISPTGNFTIEGSSGKTISIAEDAGTVALGNTTVVKATPAAMNVAAMCVGSVPSTQGTRGDVVFVVQGWN